MLYIYGENDTWSATAVDIGEKTNAGKMIKEGGNHRTRISSFDGEEKEKIYSTLEKWLDIEIERWDKDLTTKSLLEASQRTERKIKKAFKVEDYNFNNWVPMQAVDLIKSV